jgi:hypothetical protein
MAPKSNSAILWKEVFVIVSACFVVFVFVPWLFRGGGGGLLIDLWE